MLDIPKWEQFLKGESYCPICDKIQPLNGRQCSVCGNEFEFRFNKTAFDIFNKKTGLRNFVSEIKHQRESHGFYSGNASEDYQRTFNYIKENELVGKKNVVNYILTNLVDLKDLGSKEENNTLNNIKKFMVANPDSKKSKFIELISTKDIYDKLIYYLSDISGLLKKKNLTEEEKEKLIPYLEIIKKI
jgi:hypothetical protein